MGQVLFADLLDDVRRHGREGRHAGFVDVGVVDANLFALRVGEDDSGSFIAQLEARDDLALVGEQEEAWAELALGIKAASPFAKTFVVGFVGFRNCYFPTVHGIEEGGYESQLRYHGTDGFAKTVRGAVKLLHKLRKEASA